MNIFIYILFACATATSTLAEHPPLGSGGGLSLKNKDFIAAAIQTKQAIASVTDPSSETETKRVAGELDAIREKYGAKLATDALKALSLDNDELRQEALRFLRRYVSAEDYAKWIQTMNAEIADRKKESSEQ